MDSSDETPVIAIDFDGVLHSYTSGWTGEIPCDDPEPGAREFIDSLSSIGVEVVVLSSRASTRTGRSAIRDWLLRHNFPDLPVTSTKVRASLYIDDRAGRYRGNWAEMQRLVSDSVGDLPEGWRDSPAQTSHSGCVKSTSRTDTLVQEFEDSRDFIMAMPALRNSPHSVRSVEWRFRWWPEWEVDLPSFQFGDTERWVENGRYNLKPLARKSAVSYVESSGCERFGDGWLVWAKVQEALPVAIFVDAIAISIFGRRAPVCRPEGFPGGPGFVAQPVPHSTVELDLRRLVGKSFNPIGHMRGSLSEDLAIDIDSWSEMVSSLSRVSGKQDLARATPGGSVPDRASIGQKLQALRRYAYVQVPELARLSRGGEMLLESIASQGTPWFYSGDSVGPQCGCVPSDMKVPLLRELHSIRYRRKAMAQILDVAAVLSRTAILVTSRRPFQMDHLGTMLERQKSLACQIVVVAHGWSPSVDLSPSTNSRLNELNVTFVEAGSDLSLGMALNIGVGATCGDIVIRMDDDDWYSEWYVHDLILAYLYSGADVVGSSSEWVYIEESDSTLQLPYPDVERFSSQTNTGLVGGGRSLFTRAIWQAVGGFRDIALFEDGEFASSARMVGGKVYRTHGFNAVYVRHADASNTYVEDSTSFMDAAIGEWPGLIDPFSLGCHGD